MLRSFPLSPIHLYLEKRGLVICISCIKRLRDDLNIFLGLMKIIVLPPPHSHHPPHTPFFLLPILPSPSPGSISPPHSHLPPPHSKPPSPSLIFLTPPYTSIFIFHQPYTTIYLKYWNCKLQFSNILWLFTMFKMNKTPYLKNYCGGCSAQPRSGTVKTMYLLRPCCGK